VKIMTDIDEPNGVEVSPDGKTLHVSDSSRKLWRAYPIGNDGTVGPGKFFLNPRTGNLSAPDGTAIDERGNLYGTGRGGVWVVSPEAKELGLIAVPELCSNLTFGGEDGKMLYLTCKKKVYSLKMKVRGAGPGPSP
jgi:gluconolactonase